MYSICGIVNVPYIEENVMRREALSLKDSAWFRKLHNEINVVVGSDYSGCDHIYRREITRYEWNHIQHLIGKYCLPCHLKSTSYGFALVLYDHPSTPGGQPTMVCSLYYAQIPGIQRGFEGQIEAARELSRYTHSDDNQALLRMYGMQDRIRHPQSYVH